MAGTVNQSAAKTSRQATTSPHAQLMRSTLFPTAAFSPEGFLSAAGSVIVAVRGVPTILPPNMLPCSLPNCSDNGRTVCTRREAGFACHAIAASAAPGSSSPMLPSSISRC